MHKNMLSDIKKMRKSMGITQQKLSEISGISQPLIARIETGKVEPSFSNAEKIFSALDGMKRDSSHNAKDIMSRKIVFVKPDDKILAAAKIMKRKGISQMPVAHNEKILGIIGEKEISSSIGRELSRLCVMDVMSDAPPTVSPNANIAMIASMLEYSQCLLVIDKGRIEGIISRADILKAV